MTTITPPKLDMTRVIKRFAVQSDLYLERRSTGGAFQAGRWNELTPATAAVTANIQPMGGKEAQLLPEGDRTKDGIVAYASSEIVPVGRSAANRGDTLVWKGTRYECVLVEEWDTIGDYWRAVAVKVEQ